MRNTKKNFWFKFNNLNYFLEEDPKKTYAELMRIFHTNVVCQFCLKTTPMKWAKCVHCGKKGKKKASKK